MKFYHSFFIINFFYFSGWHQLKSSYLTIFIAYYADINAFNEPQHAKTNKVFSAPKKYWSGWDIEISWLVTDDILKLLSFNDSKHIS